MQLAMINDKIVPYDSLAPCYLDRGLYFGDGVYEVIRSYNGRIFAINEHLDRFSKSLAAVEIENTDIELIRSRIIKAYKSAGLENAAIYMHITRGSAPRAHNTEENLQPNFFLTVTEIKNNDEDRKKGIAVSTYPDMRWKRCDIKSLNLLPNILARRDAEKKGCKEAILVDQTGFITEGAGSTFFAVFGQTLQTAPLTANILPSISRKYILLAAENLAMEVTEESLSPQHAQQADELFVASTTKDIVPVVEFDSQTISSGKPGKYTTRLLEEFLKLAQLQTQQEI